MSSEGKGEGTGFPSLPSFPIFHPYFLFGIVLVVIAFLLTFLFMSGWIWGAGYEPTKRRIRNQMFDVLKKRFQSDERFVFYDLGSGFGGVVMDVAEKFSNAFCTGIERDWFKCAVGNWRLRKSGFGARVVLIRGNLLNLHFSDADVVYIFLSPSILKRKELKERMSLLKYNSLILSYCHKIPFLEPSGMIGNDLFLYTLKM